MAHRLRGVGAVGVGPELRVKQKLDEAAHKRRLQGRFGDAETLYQRSLKIYEKALVPEHPDVVIPLNGLAGLNESQGRYREAEPLLHRTLAMRERALGFDHPSVATALNNLGARCRAVVQAQLGRCRRPWVPSTRT